MRIYYSVVLLAISPLAAHSVSAHAQRSGEERPSAAVKTRRKSLRPPRDDGTHGRIGVRLNSFATQVAVRGVIGRCGCLVGDQCELRVRPAFPPSPPLPPVSSLIVCQNVVNACKTLFESNLLWL